MGRLSLSTGTLRRTRRRPQVPIRLVASLALLALLVGAGYLWLRQSSLVGVEQVAVVGVSSSEGEAVTAALERAALEMTTMDVSLPELRAAVADYSSVAGLEVQTGFPHDLTIEVHEREPVAVVELGGTVVPVGAGGRLMRGVTPATPLAEVRTSAPSDGGRLTDPDALRAVSVLAAAPELLRDEIARASWARKGLTLELRDGPLLILGDASRPNAKWAATARVLADPSSAGAVYLDVRVPERIAAGGLGSLTPDPQLQPEETASLTP